MVSALWRDLPWDKSLDPLKGPLWDQLSDKGTGKMLVQWMVEVLVQSAHLWGLMWAFL